MAFTRSTPFYRGKSMSRTMFLSVSLGPSFSLCLDFFKKDQLFIILEFEFGGIDLENSNGTVSTPRQCVEWWPLNTFPLPYSALQQCWAFISPDSSKYLSASFSLKKLKLAHGDRASAWVICLQLQVQFYFIWSEIPFNKLQSALSFLASFTTAEFRVLWSQTEVLLSTPITPALAHYICTWH